MIRPSPLFFALLAITAVGGVLTTVDSPLAIVTDGSGLAINHRVLGTVGIILLVLGGWTISLTLHEFGHAFVAYRGGDHSVADKGYLNMDVRRYSDPVLSLLLPLLLLVAGGIPLPGGAVWINHWALRSRAVSSWVSLTGPLTNLAFGLLLTIFIAAVQLPFGLAIGLSYLALLQIFAFVLNILPIPGLDGYGAIEPYLSPSARELGAKARPWAPLALFAALFLIPPVRQTFLDISLGLFETLGGSGQLAGLGGAAFRFWAF